MRPLLIALTLVSVTTAYNQLCTPGTYFATDCNTCACTYEGRAVCTKKACHSGYYKPGSSVKDPLDQVHHIIPGINNIEISPSHQIGESHSASFEVCTPNSFFYIGCNRCWCSVIGDTYTCTKFSCGSTPPTPNKSSQQYPQQNVPNYPTPNRPNHQYPQQNVPNYPSPNKPNQQYPQQHLPNYPILNQPNQQYPQQNVPYYPTINYPNQHYPQQNVPNFPTQNYPNQQYPQQNVPSYPTQNHPSQQYPPQNIPNYPAPNIPNPPHKSPQPSPSFPDVNQNGHQQSPQSTFPVPNVPNQQHSTKKPDQHHKHSHGCGHHHKIAAN